MNREVENPEMDENRNEIMKTKLNLEVKEEAGDGYYYHCEGPTAHREARRRFDEVHEERF